MVNTHPVVRIIVKVVLAIMVVVTGIIMVKVAIKLKNRGIIKTKEQPVMEQVTESVKKED
jgi:hypothetical protein